MVSISGNLVTPYTTLEPERSALLVIDTQNDYCDRSGARPVAGVDGIMPALVASIELFRRAGRPVVHVVRLYRADGSNVDPCRRWQFERGDARPVVAGTWGAELFPATCPSYAALDMEALLGGVVQELARGEFAVYKPRFGAFHGTPLREFLGSNDVSSTVISGVTFPNCVKATQVGATDNDLRVGLIPEACTEVDEAGLAAMQGQGVQLMTLKSVAELLGVPA